MTFLPRGLVVIEVGHDEAAGCSHDGSHTSPDELRRSPLMECGCRWVEGLLVHGIAAHKAIGSTRSCVVSNSHSLGKRFRGLKYFFEMYRDGSLVWPAFGLCYDVRAHNHGLTRVSLAIFMPGGTTYARSVTVDLGPMKLPKCKTLTNKLERNGRFPR